MINDIMSEMIAINQGDTRRIAHALKVYGLAKCIAGRQNVSDWDMNVIEAAAVLHDIAIRYCEDVYGSSGGKLQEKEGPSIARPILEKYEEDTVLIERVLYIIAHHHTYENIDGVDHQIIIEADLIVNAEEGDISAKAFETVQKKYFKTQAGKEIAKNMIC